MDEADVPYIVGFGKPPRETRFQRGKSGNPKGRPKGSKNLATIVLRECRQRVRVNGPGGSRTVTKLEAATTQLCNKAAQGDLRASRDFLDRVERAEESVSTSGDIQSFQEPDQKVLCDLLSRFSRSQTESEGKSK